MTGVGVAAGLAVVGGAAVTVIGVAHNHCLWPDFLGGCSSLGWVDQQIGPKLGNFYLNTGEAILIALGVVLLLVRAKVHWALYAGAALILIALACFLTGFPFG
jgi:hypothetical protein